MIIAAFFRTQAWHMRRLALSTARWHSCPILWHMSLSGWYAALRCAAGSSHNPNSKARASRGLAAGLNFRTKPPVMHHYEPRFGGIGRLFGKEGLERSQRSEERRVGEEGRSPW